MKKFIKIAAMSVGVVTLLLAGFLMWAFWEWDDSEIRSRVDSIEVPSSWQVTSEKIVPPINVCLEKHGCPSAEVRWKLDRQYSREELQQIFHKSGVNLVIDDECEISPYARSVSVSVCSGVAQHDGYRYNMYQGAEEGSKFDILLSIKKS